MYKQRDILSFFSVLLNPDRHDHISTFFNTMGLCGRSVFKFEIPLSLLVAHKKYCIPDVTL